MAPRGCLLPKLVARRPALVEILLMIFFGPVELRCLGNLCYDGPLVPAHLLKPLFRRPGRTLLLRRVIKNGRAVLRADVRPLPVERRRVVDGPKQFKQLIISDLSRIILHLNHFGMASPGRAHIFISRPLEPSSGVSDRRRDNTFHLTKLRFHFPKTARAKNSLLRHISRSLFLARAVFGKWKRSF